MNIDKNVDGTYNIRGDEPVMITFFDSEKAVFDDQEEHHDIEEFSVIVRGGFDVSHCDGIMEGENSLWVDTVRLTECDDVEMAHPRDNKVS